MTVVVNFKQYWSVAKLDAAFGVGQWMYVGRAMPAYGLKSSVLGNPFRGERMAVIAQFGQWLLARIKDGDKAVQAAVLEASQMKALVCWCAPLPCHASVIISNEVQAALSAATAYSGPITDDQLNWIDKHYGLK